MVAKSRSKLDAYITSLVQAGAIRVAADPSTPITLRNGSTSLIYVDHGEVLCQPETSIPFECILIDNITALFPKGTTVLCNVDSKSSPHIVGALASRLTLRQIIVSPQATQLAEKGRGLRCRFPNISSRDNIVMVDDVFTEDDVTAIQVGELIRDTLSKHVGPAQLNLHLLVGLLRGNPQICRRQLAQYGIKLHFITTLQTVIRQAWPSFGAQERSVLVQAGYTFR